MRTLWNALSFVAVVNLLALAIFAGWLWRTDRLDRARIAALRDVLAPTRAEAAATLAAADAEARRAAEAEQAAREAADPSLPVRARLAAARTTSEMERQADARLREEADRLESLLLAREARLADRERAFAARVETWEQGIAAERKVREDAQFAQTVRYYESLPPRQAKDLLVGLDAAGNREQVVAYLDAMNPRAGAKILREFTAGDEPRLARELLERLRTWGLEAAGTETAPDDDAAADANADGTDGGA